MRALSISTALAAAAALALSPVPAFAQEDVADRAKELAEQANDVQEEARALANDAANAEAEDDLARNGDGLNATDGVDGDRDDDGFPWGLLGLLGLAGLLGLKKPDRPGVDVRNGRL